MQGADQPGIVQWVSRALAQHGANVVALEQSTSDPEGGRFFQRTVFHLPELSVRLPELNGFLEDRLTDELGLDFRLVETKRRKRVAILASKADHCLLDLLWRQRRGELRMSIPMVISNRPGLGDEVRKFGLPSTSRWPRGMTGPRPRRSS